MCNEEVARKKKNRGAHSNESSKQMLANQKLFFKCSFTNFNGSNKNNLMAFIRMLVDTRSKKYVSRYVANKS